MVKLKRLKILKYRNVRPGTELRFDDGFNLVLGKNGSGKTTLLGLLAAVAGHDFERLADEEFSLEYELAGPGVQVRFSLENRLPPAVSGYSEPTYQYQLEVEDLDTHKRFLAIGTPERTLLQVDANDPLNHRPITPFRRGFIKALFNLLQSLKPSKSLLHASVGPDASFRFDETLDSFLAMTGRTSTTPGVASPRPVDITAFLEARSTRWERTYFPSTLIFALDDALRSGDLTVDISDEPPDPSRPFAVLLAKATTLLGYRYVSIQPAVASESDSRVPKGRLFHIDGFTFHFTRPDSSVIHHDLLSFGQKRLFSFFWYLECNEQYVIADELVNGLHHRWIEACMEAIGDRQAFLTSQNPLLFDYIPDFESPEQVKARFITCRTETVDGAEQLVWDNLSDEQAAVFFSAYQAEIEPVGEILITRGLW